MGIRINRVLGYGVADLHTVDDVVDDPRVDLSRWRDVQEQSQAEFIAWCHANEDMLKESARIERHNPDRVRINLMGLEDHQTWNAWDSLIYDSEFGLPSAMQFVVPGAKSWHRRDDMLDYYMEYLHDGERMKPRVEILPVTGIYPHDLRVVQARPHPDPEMQDRLRDSTANPERHDILNLGMIGRLPNSVPLTLTGGDYNMLIGRWDRNQKPLAEGDLLKHFVEDWRPQIPISLLAFILWTKCFPDAHGPNGIV